MFQKLADFFFRIAGLKTFLLALVLYIIVGGGVMGMAAKKMAEIAGKDKVEILDLQFTGYSVDKARAIMESYGPEGRKYAAFVSLVDDTIYPFVYTFSFIIILAWIGKNIEIYRPVKRISVIFLPLLLMLVDFCENACIISMLNNYPDVSDLLIVTASIFTRFKWALVAGLILMFLVTLGRLISLKRQQAV